MKNHNLIKYVLLLVISAFLILAIGCGTLKNDKIPITTTSEIALEHFLKGRDLFEKIRYQESIQFFEKAVVEDSDFAMGYLFLALVQPSAKGFFEKLDKAVSLVDNVSEGERLWILGVKAASDGFPLKQREYFQHLVNAFPNDERAHTLLGNHYFGQQEFAKAIEEYNLAIEVNPDYSQPYNQLGYAYRFLENHPESGKAFKRYIELIPDDPNPYDSYAELLMKMGRFDESIETYQKALSINPDFIPSYFGIAANLNFKGEHGKARKQLQSFYDLAKNDGQRRGIFSSIAVSYIYEGETDKALEELKKRYALAEKINDASAMAGDHIAMGNILLESGRYDTAGVEFEKAFKQVIESNLSREVKDNANRTFLFNTARVDLMKKNFTNAKAKAKEYQEKVIAINNPFQIRLSHELMGTIALEEKDYDKALEELQQANQQHPYNLYRIALVYKGKEDREKAKEFCMKAAEFNAIDGINFAYGIKKAKQLLESL